MQLDDQAFDLALVDVRMPGMNGVASSLEMKKKQPDMHFVMMTAFIVEELLQQAIGGHALGVLQKPFHMSDVLDLMQKVKPKGLILVVDDDRDFAASVEASLTAEGCRVVVAHTEEEALQRMETGGVDVLLLDLRLPILSGLEVYLEPQRRDRLVPTIVVTGYATEESEDVDALRTLEVTGFLRKPFHMDVLLRVIARALPTVYV